MVRVFLCGAALGALMACQPVVPDSGAGVGFDPNAAAQREAALSGPQATLDAPSDVTTSTLSSDPAAAPLPASVTAAVTGAPQTTASAQAAAANSGVAPVEASPSNPAPVQVNNPGISNEQNFDAVSSERSIQSDAQRIAQNRQQYRVIAPTDLPTRPGTNTPNIVEYALRTKHPLGAQLYRRTGRKNAQRHAAACAQFASPDQAQTEFLSRGGPQRDRRNLDPDGDGYACSWDPSPFRTARGVAQPAPLPSTGDQAAAASPTTSTVAASRQVPAPGLSPAVQPLVISSE